MAVLMNAWDVIVPLVALLVGALVTAAVLRRRRAVDEEPTEKPRILFPFVGTELSERALQAALRLARAEHAVVVPAYLARVPLPLALDAPVGRACDEAFVVFEEIERRALSYGVPVDSRIVRGRNVRHALRELITEIPTARRIVVAAATNGGHDGFSDRRRRLAAAQRARRGARRATGSAKASRSGRSAGAPRSGMIVGRAIYRDGRRVEEPDGFAAMASACAADGGIAWIGLYRPTREEFAAVTDGFALHELAVEDAVKAHQRAKLERYGDTLFSVLRPARYDDATETVEFGEVHVFAGPHFVITVRHGDSPDLGSVRRALERRPDLLRRGPVAVMHAIMDRVVDDYVPVVAGIENDIDEIEDEVFGAGSASGASRRIYELTREVIAFQRASKPLVAMLDRLIDGAPDSRGGARLPARRAGPRVAAQRAGRRVPRTAREHPQRQPDAGAQDVERGLLPAERGGQEDLRVGCDPLRAVDRGHGVRHELRADARAGMAFGYPFALALMVAISLALYVVFKRRRWI